MDDVLNFREIGRRIRRFRRTRNLSQEALAERANLSQVHIGHIETGAVKMSLSALIAIANALGVSPDALLSGEAYHCKEVLCDDLAAVAQGCDAVTLRLMVEVCQTIKADAARRKMAHRDDL